MKKIIYILMISALFISCQSNGVKALSADNMEDYQKLIAGKSLVLVDFNAPWCGPCKKLSPVIDEIASEKSDAIEIIKINTDVYPQISTALNIDGIPALILYKNGEIIWSHIGLISKEELSDVIAANQ